MSPGTKTIKSIAQEINTASPAYRMHDFQTIRQQIHGLSHPKIREIFSSQTIHETYAYHSGGRKEIQFNIGLEGDDKKRLRYGLAFSIKRDQTLQDPLSLRPKVLKLNEYIRKNQSELEDMCFWYYSGPKQSRIRSETRPVTPIPEDLIRLNTFLFLGKMSPIKTLRPEEVLFLFDRLLPIYEFVEGNSPLKRKPVELNNGFKFKPGCSHKLNLTFRQAQAAEKAVVLRHNKLQKTLYTILSQEYGKNNVGTENDTGRGSRVDLVMRDKEKHIYYEIKTGPIIRDCLRDAIAQLIEYSYWPGGKEAAALIIVSENLLTPDAHRYLLMLRKRFHLPIYYQHLNMNRKTIGKPE